MGRHAAEPPHEAAGQASIDISARYVVAGDRQRLEDVGVQGRLALPAPDAREQPGDGLQVVQLAQLFDLCCHASPNRRPRTSAPLCTIAPARIATANASRTSRSRRVDRARKKHANANRPSSRPRSTAMDAAGPSIRYAKAASTAP